MKYIETSISISPDHKKRLILGAEKLNISVSCLLSILMKKSRAAYRSNSALLWRAVRYQFFASPSSFTIMHVSLFPLCYEFGVSQRLVFKVSVSLIYRIAIDVFLDKIVNGNETIDNNDDITTNYFKAYYNVSYSGSDDYEYWLITWSRRTKSHYK